MVNPLETIRGLVEFGRIHIVILSDRSLVCRSTPSSRRSYQIRMFRELVLKGVANSDVVKVLAGMTR